MSEPAIAPIASHGKPHDYRGPPGGRSSPLAEAIRDVIAGTWGGIAGRVIEYPFDTIKTRLQGAALGSFAKYKGSLDCLFTTLREEGVRGLYKGMAAPLIGTVFETSTLFFINGRLKRILAEQGDLQPGEELPMKLVWVAGAATGFFVSFVLTPVELIKCRLQVVGSTAYAGPMDCLRKSIEAEGLSVMYRGHVGTMIREIPGTAAWFLFYEVLARWMTPPGATREDLPASTIIAAGALGGIAYWAIMYPADSIRNIQALWSPEYGFGNVEAIVGTSSSNSSSSSSNSSSGGGTKGGSGGGSGGAASGNGASEGSKGSSSSSTSLSSSSSAAAKRTAARLSESALASTTSSSSSSSSVVSSAASKARLFPAPTSLGASSTPASAFFTTAAILKQQAEQGAKAAKKTPLKAPGFLETSRFLYRAAGMRGLYAGFMPTILRAAPSNAAIFMVYEACNNELKKYM